MSASVFDNVVRVKPPVRLRGLIARHDVPYGRAFRYWDTNGELWIYCNRGEIADLPHRTIRFGGMVLNIAEAAVFGAIPVYEQ